MKRRLDDMNVRALEISSERLDDARFTGAKDDLFRIQHKHTPVERLRKWRQATLALNATRRFRYTLDLTPENLSWSEQTKRVRASMHALRAVQRFKEAGAGVFVGIFSPDGSGLGVKELQILVQENQFDILQQLGGVAGVARLIHADLDKGVSGGPDELEKRRKDYGENNFPRKLPKTIWVFLWEACKDTTLRILMVCAAVSLVTGMTSPNEGVKNGWYDGASIAFAIIIIVLVTAYNDYKQSLGFRSLNEEKRNIQIEVIRGGKRLKTSIFSVVVGDVVFLSIGDQVPADGILILGQSILVDESSMTGESSMVPKDAKHPFLMSSSKIVDGYGTMLVTGVGLHTQWGQVMASLNDDSVEETPLQVRLNGAATFIGKVGLAVASLVFIVLFLRYFITVYNQASRPVRVVSDMANIFSISVVIVVIAVPEGLPLAVTLALAYSMRKMMADKSLVRHLAACETMGSATTICCDKTGTLTLNQMTVLKAWICGMMSDVENQRSKKNECYDLILEGIVQNSTGSVFLAEEGGHPEVSGNPTEAALLYWALEIGLDFEGMRRKTTVIKVESFNSERKRSGVIVKVENGDFHVHWKGAAEIILQLCVKQMNADGSQSSLSQEDVYTLHTVISEMAAQSLRCIAFALLILQKDNMSLDDDELVQCKIPDAELTLIAIIGIKDPCRPGVSEAVGICQSSGVKVRMVTGDNLLTAKAIAHDCGILTDGLAIEGAEFRTFNLEEMKVKLPKLQVLARSLPTDKLLLVKKLKELNEVVAVTGDGANDAPALHEADIGLAMGMAGTEVAKESSDIIILDDNFGSVVKVIRWGRSIYLNIQKFIQFQLTINISALGLNFVAAVSEGNVPLNTVQMLWINLIMDTLAALALATEPPSDEVMQQKPVGWSEPLVTNRMWRDLIGQACYQLAVMFILYYRGEQIFRLQGSTESKVVQRNTIIFNSFVFCQIFNEINSRKPNSKNIFKGIFRSRIFLSILATTVIVQVLIVEFLMNFAQTTRLSWQEWIVCIAIGFLSLPIAFLLKFVPICEQPLLQMHNYPHGARGIDERTISSHENLAVEQGETSHELPNVPSGSTGISEMPTG